MIGDFNAEDSEPCLSEFLGQYQAKNIVKDKTCFKNPDNPSCIDLFLTNSPSSFQHTKTISTGLSDCHKMVVTVNENTFKKQKGKEIFYRDYKRFNGNVFKDDLRNALAISDVSNYESFENIFLTNFDRHAPVKKKLVRANHVPYMTKTLRKAIMRRSQLQNKYYKNTSNEMKISKSTKSTKLSAVNFIRKKGKSIMRI